jgi:hypothetical protein
MRYTPNGYSNHHIPVFFSYFGRFGVVYHVNNYYINHFQTLPFACKETNISIVSAQNMKLKRGTCFPYTVDDDQSGSIRTHSTEIQVSYAMRRRHWPSLEPNRPSSGRKPLSELDGLLSSASNRVISSPSAACRVSLFWFQGLHIANWPSSCLVINP